jgi:hypothetical protein
MEGFARHRRNSSISGKREWSSYRSLRRRSAGRVFRGPWEEGFMNEEGSHITKNWQPLN